MIRVLASASSRDLLRRITKLDIYAKRGMISGWQDSVESMRRDADREILRHPKAGRLYRVRMRSGRIRRHRASRRGETHANLTGTTRKSLSWKTSGFNEATFGYGVGPNRRGNPSEWGKYLEFNLDRPSLQIAIRTNTRNIQTYHARGIKRAIFRGR